MGFEFLAGKKHFSCFLVTIQTPDGVFYRIVDEKSFTVGRSSDSALSFPEPNISRIHIVVSCKKDQIWLIDQGVS
ncbi:MAG: FHA domain-containing protein [Bdellovibrionales bacterium]|nr:FHA domain-containing protein [Bdellovibrionales bacterium]